MAALALAWGVIAGDLADGLGAWLVLLGIPLLLLGALAALPLNIAWSAALTLASRHSLSVLIVVLLLGSLAWFAIGCLYLGGGDVPRAWRAAVWTGLGGLSYGIAYTAPGDNVRMAPRRRTT